MSLIRTRITGVTWLCLQANDRQGDRHGHGQLSQQQSSAISCVVNGPNVKREHSSTAVPANQLISSLIPVNSPGSRSSAYGASKLSPHSLAMLMEQDEEDERLDEEGRDSDYDKCSFNGKLELCKGS